MARRIKLGSIGSGSSTGGVSLAQKYGGLVEGLSDWERGRVHEALGGTIGDGHVDVFNPQENVSHLESRFGTASDLAKSFRDARTAAGQKKKELADAEVWQKRGVTSGTAHKRGQLMAKLARMGVRGADAKRAMGDFENIASNTAAANEFGNRMAMTQLVEGIRSNRINQGMGMARLNLAQRGQDLAERQYADQSQVGFDDILGLALGSFLGGAGKEGGAKLIKSLF